MKYFRDLLQIHNETVCFKNKVFIFGGTITRKLNYTHYLVYLTTLLLIIAKNVF